MIFLHGCEIKSGSGCEYHSSPSPPLVQFRVNDVLGLVGAGASRKRDEVREVVCRHALEQLVCRGEGLTCASGTHTQHLCEEGGEGGKGKREERRKVSPSYVPKTAKKIHWNMACSLVLRPRRRRETFLSFHAVWVLEYCM